MFEPNERLIVMSDLHIRSCHSKNGRLLLNVLDQIQRSEIETLVLLGDVFDFYFGKGTFFDKKFAPLAEALATISLSGKSVYFVEGNHEFGMKCSNWRGVEFLDGPFFLNIFGEKIGFCHGDLLAAPFSYRVFRRAIKAKPLHDVLRYVPGKWLDQYALWHASKSRANEKPVDHRKILAAAESWLDEIEGCKTIIFGHFHIPYTESGMKDPENKMVCLDSWDKPNILSYDGESFFRYHFKDRPNIWAKKEAKSFF